MSIVFSRVLFLYIENEDSRIPYFHGTLPLSSTIRERLLIDEERKGGKNVVSIYARKVCVYIYIYRAAIESDFSFSLLRSDNTSIGI